MSDVTEFQRQSLIFCFDLALLRPVFVNPAPHCCAETGCIYICSRSCCFGQSIDKTEQLIIPKYSRLATHGACRGAEPGGGRAGGSGRCGIPPPPPILPFVIKLHVHLKSKHLMSAPAAAAALIGDFINPLKKGGSVKMKRDHRFDSSPESASL